MNYLVTFFTNGQDGLQDRTACAQRLLSQAHDLGFDTERFVWTWDRFKGSVLYRCYPDLFTAANKLGFWAWKSYIISWALDEMAADDVLLYLDSDLSITQPDLLFKMMALKSEAVFIDSGWLNNVWTPMCFYTALGLEYKSYLNVTHVWSAIQLWTKTNRTHIAAIDWYMATLNIALNHGLSVTGSRYDQSLLSLVVARDNFTVLGNEYANAVAHPPEGVPCVS